MEPIIKTKNLTKCYSHNILALDQVSLEVAKGKVLEIGIGSGLNMPFYTGSSVQKIIGLAPSEELNEIALKKAKDIKLNIDFILNGAEEISIPNNSIFFCIK